VRAKEKGIGKREVCERGNSVAFAAQNSMRNTVLANSHGPHACAKDTHDMRAAMQRCRRPTRTRRHASPWCARGRLGLLHGLWKQATASVRQAAGP
jgi:hypothetical protein